MKLFEQSKFADDLANEMNRNLLTKHASHNINKKYIIQALQKSSELFQDINNPKAAKIINALIIKLTDNK